MHPPVRFDPSVSVDATRYPLAYYLTSWLKPAKNFLEKPLHAPNLALLHKTTQRWIKVEKQYVVHPLWHLYVCGPHVATWHHKLGNPLFHDQFMCLYKCGITPSKEMLNNVLDLISHFISLLMNCLPLLNFLDAWLPKGSLVWSLKISSL